MLRVVLTQLAAMLAITLAGCPSTLEGSPCTRAEDCSGSQVCLDGVCRALSSLPDGAIDHLDAARATDASTATDDGGIGANDAASTSTDASVERADAPAADAPVATDAEIACRRSSDCPSVAAGELFCETSGTGCGMGVCRPCPTRCEDAGTIEDTTVCGCDGQRYASPCWRQFFGVGAGEGCTDSTPIRCRSEHRGSCMPGSFCELGPATAGPCEAGDGTCVPIPPAASCDPTPGLICGCDGRTYTSDCERRSAATSARGPGFCSCARGSDCVAPDTFCDRGVAPSSGACSGSSGVCARVPGSCPGGDTAGDEVAACGSGVVHDDDCLRRVARVESAYAPPECSDGAMPSSGCCFDSTQCNAGEHCYGPATCGAAGQCHAPPARVGDCYGDADCDPGYACEGAIVDACMGRVPTPGRCVVRSDAVFGS